MATDFTTPTGRLINSDEAFNKSPFIQGLLAGLKGALVAGPAAAGVQALRGKNPILGGALGAIAAGVLAGAGKAMVQDIKNQTTEATLRYHAERLKEREPFIFMPPDHEFGPLFSQLHTREHQRGPL